MNLDLDEEESAALVALLKRTIEEDRYPMSPRLKPLGLILATLIGAGSTPAHVYPAAKLSAQPSAVLGRKRLRR